jgi:dihydroorotate dehydrogenase
MYKQIIKPFFFLFSPEKAHYLAMDVLAFVCAIPGGKAMVRAFCAPKKSSPVQVFGLEFPNHVGLAAGFDKDARWVDALECLGFGHIEIGTVTPKAQPGNDKPRLFRLPKNNALINRMGFNNGGSKAAAERLRKRKGKAIIGGNIGKNKVTPNEEAVNDYLICFEDLYDVVDYFVVNVSSPNTPGLRALQERGPLTEILSLLQKANAAKPSQKPILLKIAPDLTEEQLDDIVAIVQETKIAGVIATNTTIDRSALHYSSTELEAIGAGGLSGTPVHERSNEVVNYLHTKSKGSFPIIGVGGVESAATAKAKLEAGATLVQVYTGFIYEGPAIVRKVVSH